MSGRLPITLLYVEDEEAIRNAVAVFLELQCEKVITAGDGREALEKYQEHRPDLVLTDILMPRMDGLQLAARLRETAPQLPVIITTAFSEVPYLVRAIELGIRGFIRKPLDYDELLASIKSAMLPLVQQREIERLKAQRTSAFFSATTPQMARIAKLVEQVAEGGYSVLIHGEKGTGKSRCAKAIHAMSRRSKRPFLTVGCRAVGAERLEVELFGKERGAVGALAAAAGGTLFLHDLGSSPLQTQAKLLRFLEEGEFLPVGGKTVQRCDVRIIASITGDPRKAVAEGELLEGLYFHMSDLLLRMPSLREMPEEIPALAQFFVHEGAEDTGRSLRVLSEDALRLLAKRDWPGNVRELKNLMRRSVLHSERTITAATLQPLLSADAASPLAVSAPPPPSLTLEAVERWAIERALAASEGRKLRAAALLGIDYKRLQRKLERYGLL